MAAIPKGGGLVDANLGRGRDAAGYHARIVNAISIAVRPAQSAKVGDGIASCGRSYCKSGEHAARYDRTQDRFHVSL